MKVLAWVEDGPYGRAICELSSQEIQLLIGLREPRVGSEWEPSERIAKANLVIDRCGEALKLAEKLHALATLSDTEIPAVAAPIADPQPEPAGE